MKNVLLLLLLVLLFLTVPPLRKVGAPVIDPIGEKLAIVMEPVVVRVQTPFMEWRAKDETRAIIKLMRDQEALGLGLPRTREFRDFLQRRYRANPDGLDPWGLPYYVKYSDEGATVGSGGADLLPDTEDDITELLPSRLR